MLLILYILGILVLYKTIFCNNEYFKTKLLKDKNMN